MASKCSPIAESIAWEYPDVCRPLVIIPLGTCCLILTSRHWQVRPIYVKLHRHSNLYINKLCLKIGNLSLCVELKAVLVVKINSMITTVHRGSNLLGKGLASRTNPRKSKVNRSFRRTKGFVLIFEPGHCKLDIIVHDFLRIPVVNKYFFDYLEFIFNLAFTTDIRGSIGKTSD